MTSKKRGLSLDEKRQRMLDLFFEKKEFFQLKELERIAPKEKGIVSQSVKDVVQMLVDDGQSINSTNNHHAIFERKTRMDDITAQLSEIEDRSQILKEQIREEMKGKEDTEDRAQLLTKLGETKAELEFLDKELNKYGEFDPAVLENIRKEAISAKNAANRWTENVFAAKQWCKSKFQMDESILNRQFGIPEELDYLD